ncbi:Detected protein of unknown function [Hibiscus syriacus]|uniref:Uncharacterized protein n=1 Tax=Hibiscus syriacus TaxID=106335 RepID=A0A6A3CSK7_HIBSY|nr:uncharacterized protein LOC120151551 [Hibiscus syriacus]KAE8731557.1 Detected protein of unknown function [Hibiscus syriacus]
METVRTSVCGGRPRTGEKKEAEFQKLVLNLADDSGGGGGGGEKKEVFEKKSQEFQKILETSKEERNRIHRMQVIDRAAAAIAAARFLIQNKDFSRKDDSSSENRNTFRVQEDGKQSGSIFVSPPTNAGNVTPGPDFWSWTPPQSTDQISNEMEELQVARQTSELPISSRPVLEKDRSLHFLSIPFEKKAHETTRNLPPFQSLVEVDKTKVSEVAVEENSLEVEHDLEWNFLHMLSKQLMPFTWPKNYHPKESIKMELDGGWKQELSKDPMV